MNSSSFSAHCPLVTLFRSPFDSILSAVWEGNCDSVYGSAPNAIVELADGGMAVVDPGTLC